MSKVSIVTIVGANNIGAFLQAFCLMKTISKKGYDIEFLTMPGKRENLDKIEKIKRYLLKKDFRLLWYKIKTGKKYTEARELLPIKKFEEGAKYDLVVVGSDEMWNICTDSFVQYPQYFGKKLEANKIISYAPSAGNTDISEMKDSGLDYSSFDALSVRDERTLNLVTCIDRRTPIKVLDPTFLISSFDDVIPKMKIRSNFILVYSYGIDEVEVNQIKAFAKKNNLRMYSVGTYNSWCDKNLIVTPFEFLAYLKAARYVVASTFHGTALAINFKKQFAVSVGTSEKIKSLLDDFSLECRCFNGDKNVEDVFKQELDYFEVDRILNSMRDISLKYLFTALGEGL